jgi:hypothetical protein
MSEGLHIWREVIVRAVSEICNAVKNCNEGGVRLVMEEVTSVEQWDTALSMERYTRPQVWNEEGWLRVQRDHVVAVWLDFPVVAGAFLDMGKARWMNTVRKSSPNDITDVYVDITGSNMIGFQGEGFTTKSTIYTSKKELLGWRVPGLSDSKDFRVPTSRSKDDGVEVMNQWHSRIGWQERQIFSGLKRRWPIGMHVQSGYMGGDVCTIFVTDGPCCTSQHIDGIGGVSSMLEGWKVFMWWSFVEHSFMMKGNQDVRGLFSITRAIVCPSFRWTVLGPGATISIPSHVPHAVVTISSSFLCTWVIEESPHSLAITFDLILRRELIDPFWTFNGENERGEQQWLSGDDVFTKFFTILTKATSDSINYYLRVARQHPQLHFLCLGRLCAMRDGWALHRVDRRLEYYHRSSHDQIPLCPSTYSPAGVVVIHPFGHAPLSGTAVQRLGQQLFRLSELIATLEEHIEGMEREGRQVRESMVKE